MEHRPRSRGRRRSEFPFRRLAVDRAGRHAWVAGHIPRGNRAVLCHTWDEERFRIWAERLVRRCKVEDSKLANNFESYLDDVRRFKRWAWRRIQRKRESFIYSPCFRNDLFLRDRNARKESACTTPFGGLILAIFIRSAGVGSWVGCKFNFVIHILIFL